MPNPNYAIVGDAITQARKEASVGTNPISASMQETELILRTRDLEAEAISYPNSVGFLGWWFNDRQQLIQTKNKTTLQNSVAAGAGSLTLTDGSDFDSPSLDLGAILIRMGNEIYDQVAYEARSSGVLSTVNGIQIAHSAAEEVYKLYKLNSNYGWARALFRENNLNFPYKNVTGSRRQVPPGGCYIIRYIESTNYNGLFMIFPKDIGALNWNFFYQMGPSSPNETTDVLRIPGVGHGFRYLVEGLKEYIYHDEGETDDENKAANKKLYHLEKMLDEFGIEDQSGDQSIIVPDA